MTKIINKYKNQIYVFFAMMTNLLLLLTKEDVMSDVLYPLHLVGVKEAGFLSRTLVGSITGILWKHPTKDNVFLVHLCVGIISFFIISLFLGYCINNAEGKTQNYLLYICVFFALCPYGFASFINLFELLDIYWLLSVGIILCFSDSKLFPIAACLFIVIGLWAHFSFVLAFMPVIYIVFINKTLSEKKPSSYIFAAVIVIVSVGFTLYFITSSRPFDNVQLRVFIKSIISKAGDKITSIERYVGAAFRETNETARMYGFTDIKYDTPLLIKLVIGYFRMTFRDSSLAFIISHLLFSSPFAVLFTRLWTAALKKAENKADKLLMLLCTISPLVQYAGAMTSSDTSRWMSLMVISNVLLLSYFIKEKKPCVIQSTNDVFHVIFSKKYIIIPIALFYLSLAFIW